MHSCVYLSTHVRLIDECRLSEVNDQLKYFLCPSFEETDHVIEDLIGHPPLVTTELPHNEVEHRVAQFRQSSLHVWVCVCVSE